MAEAEFVVGDEVTIASNGTKGIIKFVGDTEFKEGTWYGIELFNKLGKNDGSVAGVRYFESKDDHGIFVRKTAMVEKKAPAEKAKKKVKQVKTKKPKNQDSSAEVLGVTDPSAKNDASPSALPEETDLENQAFKEQQRVGLFSQSGSVRFVGRTKFGPGVWVGIEFDEPVGKCDGSIDGHRYFTCEKNRGLFIMAPDVRPESVMGPARSDRPRKSGPTPTRRISLHRTSIVSPGSIQGEEIIVQSNCNDLVIYDDQGEPLDLQTLISAWEETHIELEEIQDLLRESSERERVLRRENKELKSGDGDKPLGGLRLGAMDWSREPTGFDMFDNIILLTDSRRATGMDEELSSHKRYSYFQSQSSMGPEVCFFGLQYYMKKYLVGEVVTMGKIDAAEAFFAAHFKGPSRAVDSHEPVSRSSSVVCRPALFNRVGWEHIVAEHDGRLPVVINAVPEGTVMQSQNVLFSMENTDPVCGWLINYLRSLLAQIWYPTTVCTTSLLQKKTIAKYLRDTGSASVVDKGMLPFKLQDFGFRGTASVEQSALAGTSQLVNFLSSDTMPALIVAKDFYNCDCAAYSTVAEKNGLGREVEVMRFMLDKYPSEWFACVAIDDDTVTTDNLFGSDFDGRVEQRDGCFVVRSNASSQVHEVLIGTLQKLSEKFGFEETHTGHRMIKNNLRLFQGNALESSTLSSVLEQTRKAGFAVDNLLWGTGGYWLQKLDGSLNHNGFGWSTLAATCSGSDPSEADKVLKSSRVILVKEGDTWTTQNASEGDPSRDNLVEVYRNGRLLVDHSLEAIRKRSEGKNVIVETQSSANRVRADGRRTKESGKFWRTATMLDDKAKQVQGLSANLLNKLGRMRNVQMKKEKAEVSKMEVAEVIQFYNDNDQDLAKIAEALFIPVEFFEKNRPVDAEDFARTLISGNYTGGKTEVAKADLRERLKESLANQKKNLKRILPRTGTGLASADEIRIGVAVYEKAHGDLRTLAQRHALSYNKLEEMPPKDGEDFARNLFAGVYTEDKTQTALKDLRMSLQNELGRSLSSLKRVNTRVAAGEAKPAEIEAMAALYRKYRGNLEQLSRLCGASLSLMRRYQPASDTDFATKLLAGKFTGDNDAVARQELRDRLREDLASAACTMRKVKTKEGPWEFDERELTGLSKLYYDNYGELESIAAAVNIPVEVLLSNPPEDGRDFALRLMRGEYSVDQNESAKQVFRQNLLDGVLARKNTLNRVKTKTGGAPTKEDELFYDFVGRIFSDNQGNSTVIAALCGINERLLKVDAPKTAREFAENLCNGKYSPDGDYGARAELRDRLREDLAMQMAKLKPGVMQKRNCAPSQIELAKYAAVYNKCRGNRDQLVKHFGLNPNLWDKKPPASADIFASALMNGDYTGDTNEISRATLRSKLKGDLERKMSTLKRTNTKTQASTGAGSINQSDIQQFADVYRSFKGDLDRLARFFNIDVEIVLSKEPKDSEDFASKLLMGDFTGDSNELKRKFLRKKLKQSLETQKSQLRRTNSKIADPSKAEETDILSVENLWDKYHGDLQTLGRICGIRYHILEMDAPEDARDFAQKLLLGQYNKDWTAENQKTLRDTIAGELRKTVSKLRSVKTRISTGELQQEDIEMVKKVYKENRGDLVKLARLMNTSVDNITRYPPKDEADFAQKLLTGMYTGDDALMALRNLRDHLQEDLQTARTKLKRTTTKEMAPFASPDEEDMQAIIEFYLKNACDLEKVAGIMGVDPSILFEQPPLNPEEFARNVLYGLYTVDETETAKATWRDFLRGNIKKTKTLLKKVVTRVNTHDNVMAEDVANIAKIYTKYGGVIKNIANFLCVDPAALYDDPAENAEDFARKLLLGHYGRDKVEEVKQKLRECLQEDIQVASAKLLRTNTKVDDGKAKNSDIELVIPIYRKFQGKLDKIAAHFGLPLTLLKHAPPKDEVDFATKLLEGYYAGDAQSIAEKEHRVNLPQLLTHTKSKLTRTETRVHNFLKEPDAADVDQIANYYDSFQGDLEHLASEFRIDAMFLQELPPANADEFARNLLLGLYSIESSEYAKAVLRDSLRENISSQRHQLRPTTTKVQDKDEVDEAFVEVISRLYCKYNGDLRQLARACGIHHQVIMNDQPLDDRDFAEKLLRGNYHRDMTAVAQSKLRETLEEDLQRKNTNLRKVTTKEAMGEATLEDINAMSAAYKECRGNLDKLASKFGVSVDQLKLDPPTSEHDFAKKLLKGAYSSDTASITLKKFRETLREEIQNPPLRRVETRVLPVTADPAPEDIAIVAETFRQHNGDLESIAEALGVAPYVLFEQPAETAEEFARMLLLGHYNVDEAESAKKDMIQNLQVGLASAKTQLSRTRTKVGGLHDVDPADVENFSKIYNNYRGDLNALAKACGIHISVVYDDPPENAQDFAKKLLLGRYHPDMTAFNQQKWRQDLESQIVRTHSQLHRTHTKIASGDASTEDIQAICKLYKDCRGNLDRLAHVCNMSSSFLKKNPPKDAYDFAKTLLEGGYTNDAPASILKKLRESLREDLQSAHGKLRRTTTKERSATAEPSADDIEAVAKIYIDHEGNLESIADAIKLAPRILRANPPRDSRDFAKNVLMGKYTVESAEFVKDALRKELKTDLNRQKSKLKRTETKVTAANKVESEDVSRIAGIALQLKMDLEALAKTFRANVQLLKENPPDNAEDFATKLLLGTYNADQAEMARRDLRRKMRESLQKQATKLTRTKTKIGTGVASTEDIQIVCKLWTDRRGNLEAIAAVTGASMDALKKYPPADAADFAKKLLEGVYTNDTPESALDKLHHAVHVSYAAEAGTFRRTTTKEAKGLPAPTPEEIELVRKIYLDNEGNLESIADHIGVAPRLLRSKPPSNSEEFATNLLQGRYTIEAAERVKAAINDHFKKKLMKKQGNLNRTTTKERTAGSVDNASVQLIVRKWQELGGNLANVAKHFAISGTMLIEDVPKDAEDFAKKLLRGKYQTVDEQASPEEVDAFKHCLQNKVFSLARTTTKQRAGGSVDPASVRAVMKVYNSVDGNLFQLSQKLKIPYTTLNEDPPKDAEDFANGLMLGRYAPIEGEAVEETTAFQDKLQRKGTVLNRTTTKQRATGSVDEESVQAVVRQYEKLEGNLFALGQFYKIPYVALAEQQPRNAEDFARGLLSGKFAEIDANLQQQDQAADPLSMSIARKATTLKRTTTKERTAGTVDGKAFRALVEMYEDNKGNLYELAKKFEIPVTELTDNPPRDAEDFAKNALLGKYQHADGKQESMDPIDSFQSSLQKNVGRKSKLSNTDGNRGSGRESGIDGTAAQALEMMYKGLNGNLYELAEKMQLPVVQLTDKPPLDAKDFARKVLSGQYMEHGEKDGNSTPDDFVAGIHKRAGALARTNTKQHISGSVDSEAMEHLVAAYKANKGNLYELAKILKLPFVKMTDKPPKTAEEFARNVLLGHYVDHHAQEPEETGPDALLDKIHKVTGSLTRTTTKQRSTGQVDPVAVRYLVEMYNSSAGNLYQLSEKLKLPYVKLSDKPPKNAEEFANDVLLGCYLDHEVQDVPNPSDAFASKIQKTAGGLSRTNTKQRKPGEIDMEAMEYLVKQYNEVQGNLYDLAKQFQFPATKLTDSPPKDAEDFARNALLGQYLEHDNQDVAAAVDTFTTGLHKKAGSLTRTTTKQRTGGAVDNNIIMHLVEMYNLCDGNLYQLAFKLNIPAVRLTDNPPKNAEEFAHNVTTGRYVEIEDEGCVPQETNASPSAASVQRKAASLNRTDTKQRAAGTIETADKEAIIKEWNKVNGSLPAIAQLFKIPLRQLVEKPPRDGEDFATSILLGSFQTLDGFQESRLSQFTAGAKTFGELGLQEDLSTDGLHRKQTSLSRASTRVDAMGQKVSELNPKDIDATASVYMELNGDLNLLAAKYNLNINILKVSPPVDAKDFATKYLLRRYQDSEGFESALKRPSLMRTKTRQTAMTGDVPFEGLQKKKTSLARSSTKQRSMQIDESTIKAIGELYEEKHGNLDVLADAFSLCPSSLSADPPKDAEDFATKYLCGVYPCMDEKMETVPEDVVVEGDMFQSSLGRKRTNLNRTITREKVGVDPVALRSLVDMWERHNGNFGKIAIELKINPAAIFDNSPTGAEDFARKVLSGAYQDACQDENSGKDLQVEAFLAGIVGKKTSLGRTDTKQRSGEMSEEDVISAMKFYEDANGNLVTLAKTLGVNSVSLTDKPPADARDFAIKLLTGYYQNATGDGDSMEFNRFLDGLQSKKAVLKRTTTKEKKLGDYDQASANIIIDLYNQQQDLNEVASVFGLKAELVWNNPPSDAEDFARKLLQGFYLNNTRELVSNLSAGRIGKAPGPVPAMDPSRIARAHTLTFTPKTSSQDVPLGSTVAELQRSQSKLKRTTTKQLDGSASAQDIQLFSQLFETHRGDLDALARFTGVNLELLKSERPKDAADFAKKLLEGAYSAEDDAVLQKRIIMDRVREHMRQVVGLKRSSTSSERGQ